MDGHTVAALSTILDGRWGEVRAQVREVLGSAELAQPTQPLTLEQYRARTTGQLGLLLEQPWARMGFPQLEGHDIGGSLTAFEMSGHIDLSLFTKLGVQVGLWGGAIAGLGTGRHHAAYLEPSLSGDLLGCFAMTETDGGSDVAALQTTATYDHATGEIVVHSPTPGAQKDYIGNAARDGRMAAVFAQLIVDGEGHGVHCVVVPIRDETGRALPGVTIGDCGAKIGLPGVDNGRLSFDQVRVPRENLLDRYGTITEDGRYDSPIDSDAGRFFTMLGALVRGRVSVGAGAGAATRNALAIAVRYGAARTQFTRADDSGPIRLLEYRTHQRRLLVPLARSYALALATNALTEQLHEVQSQATPDEHEVRVLEGDAAALKVANTTHATSTIQQCREACGGAGYMFENRLGSLKADSDVFTTFEGDNTVLLQLVAKGLLTRYRDSFESFDTRAMVAFGVRQAASSVLERFMGATVLQRLVTGAPGQDAGRALQTAGGQLALFEDRERHTLETLAARMRAGAGDDADLTALMMSVQPHMLALGWAHIDRVLFEALAAAADQAEGEVRDVLDRIRDLYAYSTVEANATWFLEHGRISAAESKAAGARVDELVAALAPDAPQLVEAFAIPEPWIDCPLVRA